MCDYSLYTMQNRLAEDGEELVLHKFETGSLGFASASDLGELEEEKRGKGDSFWSDLKEWIWPRRPARVCAICVPPGAHLLLVDVPRNVQAHLRIRPSELVVFTEVSGRSYSYRGALVLPNGTRVLLQDLPEGIHALVLSMSPDPAGERVGEEIHAA